MNILPFHLNVPAEITLERPQGTLVQGRYGDRVMFTLADGRVMYVPPSSPPRSTQKLSPLASVSKFARPRSKRVADARLSGSSGAWIPLRNSPARRIPKPAEASPTANGPEGDPVQVPESEPDTALERDLRASIQLVSANGNGNGHKGPHPNSQPAPTTKLEHALKIAISAAYNAERYGAETGLRGAF